MDQCAFLKVALERNYLSYEQAKHIKTLQSKSPHMDAASLCLQEKLLTQKQVQKILKKVFLEEDSNETTGVSGLTKHKKLSGNFGKYTIIEEIARGGMGVVYKAQERETKRIVALKVMLSELESQAQKRFEREIALTKSLSHPQIVAIYDSGKIENQHYYAMKYIQGDDLSVIAKKKRMTPKNTARLLEKIALTIHYAHSQKIVHRDLKPANILIDHNQQPHVTDMGLAKDFTRFTQLTQSGAVVGTPHYMAPEQVDDKSKDIGPATDIYALGVIAYELLTQRLPFAASSLGQLYYKIIHEEPIAPGRFNKKVVPSLENIIFKAMAKNPEDRYTTAKDLAEDLKKFYSGKKVKACRVKSGKWKKHLQLYSLWGVIVVLIAFIVWQNFVAKNAKLQNPTAIKKKSSKSKSSKTSIKNESIPIGWPQYLWQSCWDKESELVDFTRPEWKKQSIENQLLYAASYQKWYVVYKKLLLHRPISIERNREKSVIQTILIPPGCFWMGSLETEKWRSKNEVRHKVTISKPFYMGQYEITQKQWRIMGGQRVSYFFLAGDNAPVERISQPVARFFCRAFAPKLSVRLPTESEWEYAARSGTLTMTYMGDIEQIGKHKTVKLSKIAWHSGNSGVTYQGGYPTSDHRWKEREVDLPFSGTHPVGLKQPNAWKLYDVLGNVFEWCSDWHGDYPKGAQKNPSGPKTGKFYALRGGAWCYSIKECRVAYRPGWQVKNGVNFNNFRTGFRICVDAY